MRTLRFGKPYNIPDGYDRDIERIIDVMWNFRFNLSPRQAYDMWSEYSDTYCAGWLILDSYSDQEIYMALTESEDD
jgi:hypothetical protein